MMTAKILMTPMEKERASRFHSVLCQASDANDSLSAALEKFPDNGLAAGEISPRLAVEAFTKVIGERLSLLFSMVDGDDLPVLPKQRISKTEESSHGQ